MSGDDGWWESFDACDLLWYFDLAIPGRQISIPWQKKNLHEEPTGALITNPKSFGPPGEGGLRLSNGTCYVF
jgi:hypothetical protein